MHLIPHWHEWQLPIWACRQIEHSCFHNRKVHDYIACTFHTLQVDIVVLHTSIIIPSDDPDHPMMPGTGGRSHVLSMTTKYPHMLSNHHQ